MKQSNNHTVNSSIKLLILDQFAIHATTHASHLNIRIAAAKWKLHTQCAFLCRTKSSRHFWLIKGADGSCHSQLPLCTHPSSSLADQFLCEEKEVPVHAIKSEQSHTGSWCSVSTACAISQDEKEQRRCCGSDVQQISEVLRTKRMLEEMKKLYETKSAGKRLAERMGGVCMFPVRPRLEPQPYCCGIPADRTCKRIRLCMKLLSKVGQSASYFEDEICRRFESSDCNVSSEEVANSIR